MYWYACTTTHFQRCCGTTVCPGYIGKKCDLKLKINQALIDIYKKTLQTCREDASGYDFLYKHQNAHC